MLPVSTKAMLVHLKHPIGQTDVRIIQNKIQEAIDAFARKNGCEANEIIVKQKDLERMNEAADELGLPVTVNDKMTPHNAFWICRRE